MEDMYCTVCHGRGLDNNDCICHHCNGTGYEPLGLEDTDKLLYEGMILSGAL